jgi:hypothetical protein
VRLLYDATIWVEGFGRKPALDVQVFKEWISNGAVVTIRPIENEVLSTPNRSIVPRLRRVFSAVEFIDPDWSHPETWKALLDIADRARRNKLSPLGVVDRMVLLSAQLVGADVWTLDSGMKRVGKLLGLSMI